jgi:hypothetical protein
MSKYDDYTIDLAIFLLRQMADKMEDDPVFARQVLDEAKALRNKKIKEGKKQNLQPASKTLESEATSEKSGSTGKVSSTPDNLPDIYAIYREGKEEGLRSYLEECDLDFLKRIVSKNHLDPSGKVRRWKPKPKIINFIVETTIKRLSQGDAFRTE